MSWITLNRPEVKNAITADQRERVIALLGGGQRIASTCGPWCSPPPATASAPGRTCAPAAVLLRPEPEGAPDRIVGEAARMIRRGAQRLVAAILDCEKPVVAAVNGTAAGIGAHLAFACDLVVAAEGARFIEVFVRRGHLARRGRGLPAAPADRHRRRPRSSSSSATT